MPLITLPDGNTIEFPNKVTGLEVAEKISKSLSKQATIISVNEELMDLSFVLDNILLSPHIAGVTQEATIRMSKQAVQNVLDVFDNKVDPEVIINKNVL